MLQTMLVMATFLPSPHVSKCRHTDVDASLHSHTDVDMSLHCIDPGFDTRSGHMLSFLLPDSGRAVISYWRKYVHEVLVYRLGCLSLPRKSVGRLIDRPDMTSVVYCER